VQEAAQLLVPGFKKKSVQLDMTFNDVEESYGNITGFTGEVV